MSNHEIIWQDSFDIDIVEVDTQHKKLLELINVANTDDTIFQDEDRIMELVRNLRDYTHYHFETEELLMEKYGYSQTTTHRELHMTISRKLESIADDFKDDIPNLFRNMIQLLNEWFVDHIMYEDKQFGVELASKIREETQPIETN